MHPMRHFMSKKVGNGVINTLLMLQTNNGMMAT